MSSCDQIEAAFDIDCPPIESVQGMGMNEDRMSADRAAMERRVARFRETQIRFQREREEYFEETIEKARAVEWNGFASHPASS